MAAQITYLQNNCGFTGVFDPASVAVTWPAMLDPLALNSAASTFGMQNNSPTDYKAIIVSFAKTSQPQLAAFRTDGAQTIRTNTTAFDSYFPCKVIALIQY
jgi:hypothetical protein